MIISASYRTDIPAFYGDWFANRLRAGYCYVANPYSGQPIRVSLAAEDVAGIVFWTRNIGPFLPKLAVLSQRGYPFIVQYTITGYARALERSVLSAERTVDHVRRLAAECGPRVPVWRYDPIVLSSLTPADFHRQHFEHLARALQGASDEVVISFAQIYRKTLRNMNAAARRHSFTWEDPVDEIKRALVLELAQVAKAHGIQLTVCAQPEYVVGDARPAYCIDAARLSDVAGRPIIAPMKGNRPGCACYAARDIGEYDTCPHGCVYCYAVADRRKALRRHKAHDPSGEFLFPPGNDQDRNRGALPGVEDPRNQLRLF